MELTDPDKEGSLGESNSKSLPRPLVDEPSNSAPIDTRAARFGEQYKEWIEAQNRFFAEYGVFGKEWRQW